VSVVSCRQVLVLSLAMGLLACTKEAHPPAPPEPLVIGVSPPPSPPALSPPALASASAAPSRDPAPAPAVPSLLDRARAAALEGRSDEVRRLLEAKVRSGKGSPEEVRLVRETCRVQHDLACVKDITTKYP
jgi:hypothetical protein